MTKPEFLMLVQQNCLKADVQLILSETATVPYPVGNLQVNGYFDDIHSKQPTLACAIGKPEEEWLPTFVHETCHMDQWLYAKEFWNRQYADGKICDKIMDEWIDGKDYPIEEYTRAIRTMQELEIDCEERTVAKINKLQLPIDPLKYTKSANAYLLFYSVILTERKWYKRAPYQVPAILKIMPDRLLTDYTRVRPAFLKLCKKYVLPKNSHS